MDWKLCLWQGLDQYEAARSPSKQVITKSKLVFRNHIVQYFPKKYLFYISIDSTIPLHSSEKYGTLTQCTYS